MSFKKECVSVFVCIIQDGVRVLCVFVCVWVMMSEYAWAGELLSVSREKVVVGEAFPLGVE